MQYIVLQPISPDQGLTIYPAKPDEPPVLIDGSIVRGETDEERAVGIARLIALGVIAEHAAPAKPAATAATASKE